MIIYFTDRRLNVVGKAAHGLSGVPAILSDSELSNVDNGVSSFTCEVDSTSDFIKAGNYILFKDEDGHDKFYTIIDVDKGSGGVANIYAEDAGLDLLNEVVGSYEPEEAQYISHYIERFTVDSGFEIGLNELSDYRKLLSWSGESTAAERVLSVVSQFDGEMYYSFETDGFAVTKKLINLVKKRGSDIGAELRVDKNVNSVKVTESIANLVTALYATGATPEGEDKTPITLNGYNYDDGRFYVSGNLLLDRESNKRWSRYITENTTDKGYIVGTFSHDTVSQSELCYWAAEELKKRSEPEINYEVDIAELPKNVRIGDTVSVVDDKNEIYLSARVLELTRSRTTASATAVIGNYLIKNSGISERINELAQQIRTMTPKNGRDAVSGYLSSDSVVLYADENGIGSYEPAKGVFTVVHGNEAVPADKVTFSTGITSNCRVSIDSAGNYSVSDVTSDMATAVFTAVLNETVISKKLVIAKVMAGLKGKDGAGISGSAIHYQASGNGNTAPTGTWLSYIPDVGDNQYLWTRTTIMYTDNTSSVSYSVSRMGAAGQTSYLHVKYSAYSDGTGFSDTPNTYMGVYTGFAPVAPTVKTAYVWTKIAGDDGGNVFCKIVPSATVFNSNDGGDTITPETIDLAPYFQLANYNTWQYSSDGGVSWATVTGSENGLSITSNGILTVNSSSTLLKENGSVNFKLLSDVIGIADVVTVTKNVYYNDLKSIIEGLESNTEVNKESVHNIEKSLVDLQDSLGGTLKETWEFYYGDEYTKLQENVAAILSTIKEFSVTFTEIEEFQDAIGNTINSEISNYMRFNSEGQLIIGSTDSAYQTMVDDDSFNIISGGNVIATFAQDGLITKNGVFTDGLRTGNVLYQPYANGLAHIWGGN